MKPGRRYAPPAAQYRGYGGLAFDGTHLWQADAYGSGIYKLNPADCTVLAITTIKLISRR